MNKQIRILSGLHSGAESRLTADEGCVIGSDPNCSVVLYDAGVAARHCVITLDAYGVTCRALDASILVDNRRANRRKVAPGEALSLEDCQTIQCGSAVLAVGSEDAEWPEAQAAVTQYRDSALQAVRSLKRLNPYALFAAMLVAMTCAIGLAYAALSTSELELTPARIAAARQWLKTVAPAGSELQIGAESTRGAGLVLSGYVPFAHQVTLVSDAARNSGFQPRIEVYAVDFMVASMTRLAQLAGIPCSAQYRDAGRLACDQTVTNQELASRLRVLARDVGGLRDLEVNVKPLPVASPPVVAAPVQITQKFSVLMFRHTRYLVGRHGKKYREGDEFDGFKISRIGLDQVVFERDGTQYEFYVAALADERREPGSLRSVLDRR